MDLDHCTSIEAAATTYRPKAKKCWSWSCIIPVSSSWSRKAAWGRKRVVILWIVISIMVAKDYWKHFKLFTRLKGWNGTLNTSNFTSSGPFLVAKWYWSFQMLKINYFQKVIIWLKALKLRTRNDALCLQPHSNNHVILSKLTYSCPVIKMFVLIFFPFKC